MIEIESCGPLCTIQDTGRTGWRRIGLPRSGALDTLALALANTLVGNPWDAPAIELFLAGMSIAVSCHPVRLAIAGAEMPTTIDGERIAAHRSFVLHPGQRLTIGAVRRGATAVLAVEGGLVVPLILGSASLHVRSGVGGLDGRSLRPGDRIAVPRATRRTWELGARPLPIAAEQPLRIVPGPQDTLFSPADLDLLGHSEFRVTHECDRMAYRLNGRPLSPGAGHMFVSDGMVEGALQVTGSGQLIVPLADCQTIGGYPKIATLATADRRLLAQAPPGTIVRFVPVPVEVAQSALRDLKRLISSLPATLFVITENDAGVRQGDLVLGNVGDACVSAHDPATWDPPSGAQICPAHSANISPPDNMYSI
jgi:biotin-dependent carboxylase-like uncharacterized protein